MAEQQPTESGHAQQQEVDENMEVMAEQQPTESGQDQQRGLDEVIELGQGETSDDNQLLPYAGNLSLETLEKVVKGSRGNIFKFEMHQHQHQTTQNTTNVTGNVVENKLEVKDVGNVREIQVGDNQTSKPQEMPETPRNQRYIDEARDSHRPHRSSNTTDEDYHLRREIGRMQLEEYDDDMTKNLTTEEYKNLQTGASDIYGREKVSQTPLALDSQSQTEETITRTTGIQTDKKISYPTEMQTDEIITPDRMLQTEMEVMMDSDSQTSTQRPYGRHEASSSVQMDAYSQTVKKFSSETLVQTDRLQLSTNETQTVMKVYLDNDIQTDEMQTVASLTQTSANVEAMPGIHTVVMEAFHEFAHRDEDAAELKMLRLYEDEDTSQHFIDFQSLFTIVGRSIQFKIVKKSFERHQTSGREDNSLLVKTCLKLISEYNEANDEDDLISDYISRVNDVFKLGLKLKSENKPIHAIVTFYAAAKLQKLRNNGNDSVHGIEQCLFQITLVVQIMTKQSDMRKLVLEMFMPMLKHIKGMLVTIKHATNKYLVEQESRCLYNIALCYYYCNEYEQCINMNESAIELMRRHFKDEAEKYKIYGFCLNNAGYGFERMGKTEKAVEYYEMALKAYEKATNWENWRNDEQKNETIALTGSNLKILKEKLCK